MISEYTKTELLASKRYAKYKDLLNALLADDKRYSIKEADRLINNYLKKGV